MKTNNKIGFVSLEETPIELIAPKRTKANIEKCNRICETYLQVSKLPQFINDKAMRLQIACQITKVRKFYLT